MKPESRKEVVKLIIDELKKSRNESFSPTPDIDLVWVLSAPGTVSSPVNHGIIKDRNLNLERIQAGINIVKAVTALKLNKLSEKVTKTDINKEGPRLLYNGEDTINGFFPQNEHLQAMTEQLDFPLPISNVVIRRLDEIYTPGQIKDLAKYIQGDGNIKKVAVVTHAPHASRVGRYLKKYQYLFPNIEFVKASISETQVPVENVLIEIKKILKYLEKGDLDKNTLI